MMGLSTKTRVNGGWSILGVEIHKLWVRKYDPPLWFGYGMMLTAIEGDWLGRTALVDVKAKRNHIFAEETCEIRMRASCSRPLIQDDAIAYMEQNVAKVKRMIPSAQTNSFAAAARRLEQC
jgi:hypothetical protein